MDKTCTVCKKTKLVSEFSRNARRKDGFQSECKTCKAEYRKNDYSSKFEFIRAYKDGHPCQDCGRYLPGPVLHFHHRDPSQKVDAVSQMASQGVGLRKIIIEIEKCDLLCPTCHAIREYHKREEAKFANAV